MQTICKCTPFFWAGGRGKNILSERNYDSKYLWFSYQDSYPPITETGTYIVLFSGEGTGDTHLLACPQWHILTICVRTWELYWFLDDYCPQRVLSNQVIIFFTIIHYTLTLCKDLEETNILERHLSSAEAEVGLIAPILSNLGKLQMQMLLLQRYYSWIYIYKKRWMKRAVPRVHILNLGLALLPVCHIGFSLFP